MGSVLAHDFQDRFEREGVAVGAFGGERVVDIRDGKDAGGLIETRAVVAAEITFAIQTFMVGGGDFTERVEAGNAAEDFVGIVGVLLDDFPFGGVQFAGFFEDGVGDAELADVVEEGGAAEEFDLFGGEVEGLGDGDGGGGDTVGVAVGERRLGVDDFGEGLADIVDAGVSQREAGFDGFKGPDVFEKRFRIEAGPEGFAFGEGFGGGHEIRVKPAAGALAGDFERACGTVFAPEDFERLAEEGDAGEEGDGVALQAVRVAGAGPVFVERVDAGGDGFGESHAAADAGAAFAADFDEIGGVGLAVDSDTGKSGDAFQQGFAGGDVTEGVLEAFEANLGPVRGFDVALGAHFVSGEDMEEAGSVAAAAGVLDQKGVIEIGLLVDRHGDFRGDAHAEDASAGAVAHGLAFGKVEGVRKRRDHFGHTNLFHGLPCSSIDRRRGEL